ncbi:chemotaxis protein CheR [bacterium]|nr:chemotaxis protein CheR [bacterium]
MAFTYFFRDKTTLDFIGEEIVPTLKAKRFINIWDAGCAMGPEPYSIAMMFREHMGAFVFRNVKIFATDIDNTNKFGEIIYKGLYPHDQVKRIDGGILQKYFSADDDKQNFKISDEIKHSVRFQKHDLLCLQPVRQGFSLIVCKNVLLHFTPEERIKVMRMFYEALDDNGFLALEQTQKMPDCFADCFESISSKNQIFRKRNGS